MEKSSLIIKKLKKNELSKVHSFKKLKNKDFFYQTNVEVFYIIQEKLVLISRKIKGKIEW